MAEIKHESKGRELSEEAVLAVAPDPAALIAKAAALREQLALLDAEIGVIPVGPEDLVSIKIDMAPYANYLQIAGKQFVHGMSYMVEQGTAGMLYEQMRRSWQHEGQLSAAENPLRKKLNQQVH